MSTAKRGFFSVLLCVIIMFSSFVTPAFAAGMALMPASGGAVAVSYRVLNASNQVLSQVTKGQTVNIELRIKNTDVKTSAVGTSSDLDITKLLDSFTGGSAAQAVIESSGDDPLVVCITFPNVVYSGTGNALHCMIGYKKLATAYDSVDVSIHECVEYVTPTDQPAPAPLLLISRYDTSAPVQAGQAFTVILQVKNVGKTAISSVIATFSPSDSLMLTGNSTSVTLSNLNVDGVTAVSVSMRALDEITSSSQSLGVELKYNYYSAGSTLQGSTSEKIPIAAVVRSGKDTAPLIQIGRSDHGAAVKPGQSFTVTLVFKNVGKSAISSAMASVAPSDSLMLLEDSSSFVLPDLSPGNSTTVTVHLRSLDEITSAVQNLSVDLKYNYSSGSGTAQGNASEKVPIAAVANASSAPMVQIGRSDIAGAIEPNEEFSITVWFKNLGDTAITTPFASFSTTDSLMLAGATSSAVLPTLGPGKTAKVKLKLKALGVISNQVQSVNVDLKFNYSSSKAPAQGTASEKLIIPMVPSDGQSASTPNVIISKYSYGGGQVAAGSTFKLSMDFMNTSLGKAAENIVMTLDPAEGLAITSSSNTYYFASLAAGETKNQTIEMQALTGGKSMSPCIDITFKYEFMDQGKRTPVTMTEKISIPVYQPDRFEITAPVIPEEIPAGQEYTLSLTYFNKGKSDASNVSAFIEGSINALSLTQNLGNFEPGKSGTIDFILKPEEVGEADFVIKVTYENANQQTITREFPIKLNVSEPPAPEPEEPTEPAGEGETPKGGVSWVWWCGGAVAAALAMFFTLRIRKKRKAAKSNNYVWEDDEPEIEPKQVEDHEKK